MFVYMYFVHVRTCALYAVTLAIFLQKLYTIVVKVCGDTYKCLIYVCKRILVIINKRFKIKLWDFENFTHDFC